PAGGGIRANDVRGVRSEGMLCSAAELDLEESSAGLLLLDPDSEPGTAIGLYLELDDAVIDIDLTPNRGDCLSVLGIARELAVLTPARLKCTEVPGCADESSAAMAVDIRAKAACPHYVARIVRNIDPRARTPDWMRERLRRCGLRPISAVVDVTNYVMLELGQPMHAFDRARVSGGLVVRQARPGEEITLLDGTEATLSATDLLIADQEKPLALAGVMGGADSAIGDDTQDIVLEAAHFARDAIQGQARKLGVQSDSAFRFERGVDPWLPVAAMHYATVLLKRITGGDVGKIVAKLSARHLSKRSPIEVRSDRIERVLGLPVTAREIDAILKRISKRIMRRGNRWHISPPSYRFDIESECDVIEEVARVRGYSKLPARLPDSAPAPKLDSEAVVGARRVKTALVDRGYSEIITYSFVDPGLQRLLDPAASPIALANPISEQLSVMRSSLWPGLIQTVMSNLRRQHQRVRVFEIGKTFHKRGSEIRETNVVGGAVYGSARPVHWRGTDRETDFFDVKGDLEALLTLTGSKNRPIFKVLSYPALHPNQAAEIRLGGETVGKIGKLHPEVLKQLDIESDIYMFQLDWSVFNSGAIPNYRTISKFPSIARDLAVVVDESTTSHKLLHTIRAAAGKWLAEIRLFDVYRGPSVGEGRKSLAFTLTLRDSSRTLTDNEVESVIAQVTDALGREFGAELRT
ncbi:MAG: phenylalanine--tRNA ligase subunit beta, partial [Gammaproteobacteria bacterium]|nr:phenylalanine--tRNA ligase subunit beta [Gammaproteobacteria bacterium]